MQSLRPNKGDHIRGVAIALARSGVRTASVGSCGVPSPSRGRRGRLTRMLTLRKQMQTLGDTL